MIIRSKHDKRNPYLTISMKILRDRRLTPEERDCLIMMLSNADNWEFSYTGLATQLGIRRETVKTRVQGLIDKGYVSVSYPTGENGKPLPFAKGVWEIREEPITSAGFSGTRKPAHMCPISSHEDLGTKEQALNSSHEDLDANERTQRTTAGTKGVLLPKEYQLKEYQGENHQPPQKQVEVEEEDPSLPLKGAPTWESSSEAKASPLSDKNPDNGEQVISPMEFKYQLFLKKYPKAPKYEEREETRKAFFEIPNLEDHFEEIMYGLEKWCKSSEWNKEEGKYIKKPLKWLKERQWEKIEQFKTFRERLDEVLPEDEEDFFNEIN